MALPAYANNQLTFPAMYEQWLVGPLFRPSPKSCSIDCSRVPASGCSMSLAARGSSLGWPLTHRRRFAGGRRGREPGHARRGPRGRSRRHLARGQRAGAATGRQRSVRRGHLPAGPAVLPGSPRRSRRDAPGPGARRADWRGHLAVGRRIPAVCGAAARGRASPRPRGRPAVWFRRRRGTGGAAARRRLRDVTVDTVPSPCASTTAACSCAQRRGPGRYVGHGQGDERGSSSRGGGGDRRRQRRRLALLCDGPAAAFDLSTNLATGRG